MDVVLWCGPVYADTLNQCAWPAGTQIIVESQGIGGIGSSAFAALGASYGANPLQAIVAKHGIDWSSIDRIAVVGYSAAHGLIEKILSSPDGASVDVLGSMDAYFTAFDFAVKPGYLAFAQRAAAGQATALFTTSDGSTASYPSSTPAVQQLLSGFSLAHRAPPAGVPQPYTCVGDGNLWWAHYRNADGIQHADHANKLAAPWSNALLAPALAGQSVGGFTPDETIAVAGGGAAPASDDTWLWVGGAVVVGIVGALLIGPRRFS